MINSISELYNILISYPIDNKTELTMNEHYVYFLNNKLPISNKVHLAIYGTIRKCWVNNLKEFKLTNISNLIINERKNKLQSIIDSL